MTASLILFCISRSDDAEEIRDVRDAARDDVNLTEIERQEIGAAADAKLSLLNARALSGKG